MAETDPFHLARFLTAQESHYAAARAELEQGHKVSHWMWFIFPQRKGLGLSHNSRFYGVGSRAEAEAYLAHPVLGGRLRELTGIVNGLTGATALSIFGSIDAMKFHSSMTLFAAVDREQPSVFTEALVKYFNGVQDPNATDFPAPDQGKAAEIR